MSNAKRLLSYLVASHDFLAVVKTALLKQKLFFLSLLLMKSGRTYFLLSLKILLFMLQPNVILILSSMNPLLCCSG